MTLIELIVVCAILGVLAGVAMPRINTAGIDADGAQRTVRGALMRGQRIAVQRQMLVAVAFDTVGRRMRIYEDTDANGRIDASDRKVEQPLPDGARFLVPPVMIPGTPAGAGAVRAATFRTVMGYPAILFYRHGAASTDLVAYVGTTARTAQYRAISVSPATGRNDGFRWNGSEWKASSY